MSTKFLKLTSAYNNSEVVFVNMVCVTKVTPKGSYSSISFIGKEGEVVVKETTEEIFSQLKKVNDSTKK